MKESLIELCNRVINNYKKSKEDFRYDGEYINHFASLIYGNRNKEVPTIHQECLILGEIFYIYYHF